MSRTAISCGDNNERAVCAVAHRTRVGSEPPAVGIAAGFFFIFACLWVVGANTPNNTQLAAGQRCGGVQGGAAVLPRACWRLLLLLLPKRQSPLSSCCSFFVFVFFSHPRITHCLRGAEMLAAPVGSPSGLPPRSSIPLAFPPPNQCDLLLFACFIVVLLFVWCAKHCSSATPQASGMGK